MIFKETKSRAKKDPVLKEQSEKLVHLQVCAYLNLQFPGVVFCSDPSGLRVTMGLRQEINRKSPNRWKVPDLIILESRKGYSGLLLELKKSGTKLTKKDGSYVNEHFEAQAKTLAKLKGSGYAASFAIGFEDAVNIIKDYLA